MEKYFYSLLFLFSFMLCSCDKDNPNVSGHMTAVLNKISWQAKGNYNTNAPLGIGIDLQFDVSNSSGLLREHLFVFKIPYEIGRFDLTETSIRIDDGLIGSTYYTLSHDGDVIDDVYDLLVSAENTIELTEVDKEARIVKGILNATYLIDPKDEAEVDTIRIENGVFEVTLRD